MTEQKADADHLRQTRILTLSVTTTLLSLCIISYVLRLLSRRLLRVGLWWDDKWMGMVLFICSFMSSLEYAGLTLGAGRHMSTVPSVKTTRFILNLLMYRLAWVVGTGAVKIGLLLSYYRIFAIQKFRRMVLAVGMAVLVTHTALFVEVLFQCMPIDTQWNPQPGGQCHSAEIILISSGVINMVGDIIVLTLPIKRVWSLNISRGQKIAISTLFLMGLFVSVTSVFRILALKSEFSSDFTWTGVRGAIWTTVEVQTGFICANLPHCRPLVLRLVGIQVKVQQSGSARMVPPLTAPRSRHRVTFNGTGFKRMTDGSKEGVHVTDTDVDWNALEPDSSVALQGITVQTEIMQSVERMSGKSSEEVAFAPKTTIEHCR